MSSKIIRGRILKTDRQGLCCVRSRVETFYQFPVCVEGLSEKHAVHGYQAYQICQLVSCGNVCGHERVPQDILNFLFLYCYAVKRNMGSIEC